MNAARDPLDAARGDPTIAALTTWIVPGMGHLYLKAPAFGVAAFLVVQGLYWLGLRLSDGMAFEFLQADLRSPLAGALTPEVGNLGALIWHMRDYGYGPGYPRPWPEHIRLGAWLTAASGMLNAFLMVRAHVDARLPTGRHVRIAEHPATLALLAWLVPGLGHAAQGRRKRGLVVFVLLVGLVVLGTLLAAGSNLDRERHFYYWGGQFLTGIPAMVLEATHGHARLSAEVPYVDAGLVFASLAGLLNVLAMLDVYGWAEARILGPRAAAPGAAEARA